MAEEIPAENDWCDAGADVGAAAQGAGETGAVRVKEVRVGVLRRSECEPQRHDVGAVFKLACKESVADYRGQDLAGLKTAGEEPVVVAIAEAIAAVQEWAVFPAQVLANLGDGIVGTRNRDSRGESRETASIQILGGRDCRPCRHGNKDNQCSSGQHASLLFMHL